VQPEKNKPPADNAIIDAADGAPAAAANAIINPAAAPAEAADEQPPGDAAAAPIPAPAAPAPVRKQEPAELPDGTELIFNSNAGVSRKLRVLRMLGKGGYSTVYLVEDAAGDLWALKVPLKYDATSRVTNGEQRWEDNMRAQTAEEAWMLQVSAHRVWALCLQPVLMWLVYAAGMLMVCCTSPAPFPADFPALSCVFSQP
jgi:hypothetical protein